MKKWEYMLVGFQENKIRVINGKQTDNFKVPWFGSMIGTDKTDFLNNAGKEGWEAVSLDQDGVMPSASGNILFKRELEEK